MNSDKTWVFDQSERAQGPIDFNLPPLGLVGSVPEWMWSIALTGVTWTKATKVSLKPVSNYSSPRNIIFELANRIGQLHKSRWGQLALNLNPRCDGVILDSRYRVCQLTITWMFNIRQRCKPRMHALVDLLAKVWPPCCSVVFVVGRTHSRSMPLAM